MKFIRYGEHYNSDKIDDFDFDDVESIGESAFANSSIRTALVRIRNVGKFAFSVCESLQGRITVSGETIGRASFERCPKLEEVVIEEDVRRILPWAFYECTNLKDIAFKGELRSIGEEAFHKIGISSLRIGSVDEIESHAFSECKQLTSVNIESINKSIRCNAFNDCSGLKTLVIAGKTLINLSDNQQFMGIIRKGFKYVIVYDDIVADQEGKETRITHEIDIPEDIPMIDGFEQKLKPSIQLEGSVKSDATYLKDGIFRECKTLREVELSDVKHIGRNAFDKCSNLIHVILPSSLEEIGECAFQDSGLSEIDLSHTRNKRN